MGKDVSPYLILYTLYRYRGYRVQYVRLGRDLKSNVRLNWYITLKFVPRISSTISLNENSVFINKMFYIYGEGVYKVY